MRALLVEALDERIEAGLLLQEVASGRLGGLLLEGEVHAFMAAILLRMAGLDALDRNPQAQPPHRELAEAEDGVGAGERHAVVGTDGPRQAELLENPLEHAEGVDLLVGGEGLAAEQVAG